MSYHMLTHVITHTFWGITSTTLCFSCTCISFTPSTSHQIFFKPLFKNSLHAFGGVLQTLCFRDPLMLYPPSLDLPLLCMRVFDKPLWYYIGLSHLYWAPLKLVQLNQFWQPKLVSLWKVSNNLVSWVLSYSYSYKWLN